MRRSGRVVNIIVPTDAVVVYNDYIVRVIRGSEWLYKFKNIRYFQVYNIIEGYQTYHQSAPEGREFPGFGKFLATLASMHPCCLAEWLQQ